MVRDSIGNLKRRLESVQRQIRRGFLFTIFLTAASFFLGSRVFLFPMVFIGMVPLMDGLSKQRQIRERLRELSGDDYERLSEVPDPGPRLMFRSSAKQEVEVFRAAKERNGILTPVLLTMDAGYALDVSERLLEDLAKRGYARMEVTSEGKIEYHFPDFMSSDPLNKL